MEQTSEPTSQERPSLDLFLRHQGTSQERSCLEAQPHPIPSPTTRPATSHQDAIIQFLLHHSIAEFRHSAGHRSCSLFPEGQIAFCLT
ncbi:hypothetical protein TMatcc_002633 [Talaromyces marneffei ATCC 18224]